MKNRHVRYLSLIVLLSILLSACGGGAATEAAANTEVSAPTNAPAASTTPEVPSTQITIDGDSSDWEKYPVNMTDPAGDQQENYPDIVEAHYFKNDKYLYILINVAEQGEWTKLGIHFATEGGGEGQISIFQPFGATIRGGQGPAR